jgi:general secretion pathway protein G
MNKLIPSDELSGFSLGIMLSFKKRKRTVPKGYTLLELVVVIATIAALSSLAVLSYSAYVGRARITTTKADIYTLEKDIKSYEISNGELPDNLGAIGHDELKDPWANPYQYLNFANIKGKGKGKMRKDRFTVPLNTDYDLYSMGRDGQSKPPLTAKASHDDIIRANDGEYVGIAWAY